jgi:glycosyltransferase involved in cell wall biosynthesis
MKMCQALALSDHEVTLVGWDGGAPARDTFDYYGVTPCFELVRFNRLRMPGTAFALAAQMGIWARRRPAPDLYFARSTYGAAAVANTEVPLIYEVHMPPQRRHQGRVEGWLFSRPNFAGLVTISEALRQEYLRLYPQLGNVQVTVAPDGADLPDAVHQSDATDAVLQPTRPDRLQVGYTGHFYPGRGTEIILRLAEQLPDMSFHLIGGRDPDVARLRSRSRAENLHIHGFKPPHMIPSLLRSFDILLAPYQENVSLSDSRTDTGRWMSPLKIFEYMGSRTPMIASDLPVLREVLEDGVNCLLCSPGDVEQWAAAIRRLSSDPDLRARLGEAAYRQLEDGFTWSRRASRVLRCLV